MELPKEIEDLMIVAVNEAANIQSEAVEPIHLFIAVCKLNPPIVTASFQAHALDPKSLRRRLRATAGDKCLKHNEGPQRVSGRAMNVLDRARSRSQAYGYPLSVACLLISLLEFPDQLLRKSFSKEGVPIARLVSDLNRRLTDEKKASQDEKRKTDPDAVKPPGHNVPTPQLQHPATPYLDMCGRDYTALAREGKIDPVIGRRDEIKRVIRILLQKQKNNPALVGDAGVGKTSIVEGLALRASAEDAPREIRDWRIVELLVTALVAGTTYRGDLEEKLKRVMAEVESDPQLILFIDELHTLIGAGSASGTMDIANILKPALARGRMRVIGATTTAEYRRHIEKDPALERRFQPVRVEEPTPAQAREILAGLRSVYESHHGVRITDEALAAAVELSVEYLADRRLPDKARDLIDQAAVRKRFISLSPGKAAADTPEVTREDIAEVIAAWVGIPVERLFFKVTAQQPAQIEEALQRRVIGQDEALAAVASAVRTALAGLAQPERPSGVLLFMGPTGVGKTELAKALAEFLFGDERRLIRFDMSEYMEEHSVAKLIGAPPGYVGHDQGGLLTDAIRSNPYSVILFDEIEKAHPRVSDLFLQIFDDGRLTDSRGRVANFRNTIIILTTNIRSTTSESKKQRYGFIVDPHESDERDEVDQRLIKPTQEELREVLLTHFRPELINRIGKIVQFRSLGPDEIRAIIDKLIERVGRRLKDKDLELRVTEQAYHALTLDGYKPEWGARELERIIEHKLVEPLAQGLLNKQFKPGEIIYVVVEGNSVALTNREPDKRPEEGDVLHSTLEPLAEAKVAMLLVDVVGSTKIVIENGDTLYAAIIERLHVAIRSDSTADKMRFLKCTGDGFLIVYDDAVSSIKSARKLQTLMNPEPVNIRLIIHYGKVKAGPDGDPLGAEVHRLFRLESLEDVNCVVPAAGGRNLPAHSCIVSTRQALEQLPETLRSDFELIGKYSLKGFDDPEEVWAEKLAEGIGKSFSSS